MVWTCLNTEERLSDYLDGLLAADDRAAMEAHLAGCASCPALVADVRSLAERLPLLEPAVEPTWLVYRILEATSGTAREKKANTWKRLFAGLLAPRFAVGFAAVAATIFFLCQAAGINPKKITAEDLNPINVYRAADRQAHLTYARGVRFVNDLRVVYEIRSRLQEASATPNAAPQPEERKSTPSPQSEHQLKNDLLHRGPSAIAVTTLAGLSAGGLL
ncbi:MAG TPA: zf-HC2 domain-containing protein [Candidatus Acidoferrales bacterium]|nr:zf-HC2 domain-containing protein [Candidatus Acidoferrales bacterium]